MGEGLIDSEAKQAFRGKCIFHVYLGQTRGRVVSQLHVVRTRALEQCRHVVKLAAV